MRSSPTYELRSKFPTPRRLLRFYWVCGVLWTACHLAGLLGPFADGTFVLLTASTLAGTVYGIRRYKPSAWWPWALVTLSLATFLIGGALREQLQTTGDLSAGRSLLPDYFTVPGYLIFGCGLAGLVRARGRESRSDLDALLDAMIAGLSALSFAWLYLVSPALYQTEAPLAIRLSLAVYPTISVIFVVVTARLSLNTGRTAVAHRTLLAAMVLMLAGDITYTLVETHLVVIPPRLLDVPYALAYLFFGGTVLHPGMVELSRKQDGPERADRGRLTMIGVALTVPAFVSLAQRNPKGSDRVVLVSAVLALTFLVVVRVLRAIRSLSVARTVAAYQANHDSLTGLLNRRALEHALQEHLAAEEAGPIAILFLDLDRFKIVNDSGGHSVGDQLLVGVATRLSSVVPAGAEVFRIGGDEFVILLSGYEMLSSPLRIAEHIRDSFHAAFIASNEIIYSSASIGIATTPCDSAENLLRDADTALYAAKDAGRDSIVQFDSVMRNRVADRLALDRDLHDALSKDQLHLQYQAIVELSTGKVHGFEALLRWSHPARGNVPPLDFISTAEETGLIGPIGAWVIEQVCRQLAQWRAHPGAPVSLYVSVNLSMRQLRDAKLADFITRLVADEACLRLPFGSS